MDIYYINSKNEKLILSEWPLAVTDITQLYTRRWNVEANDNILRNRSRLKYVYRTTAEFTLDIAIYADSKAEYDAIYNNFEDVTDYDLRTGTPGKLYVGEYYLTCFLRDETPSEYEELFDTVNISLTVYSAYPHWIKEVKYTVLPHSDNDDPGEIIDPEVSGDTYYQPTEDPYIRADYPRDYIRPSNYSVRYPEFDYPHDYKGEFINAVLENSAVTGSEFLMVIWGYAVNPSIIIGDNIYAVNATIYENWRLEIDSREKTVTLIDPYGNETNLFNARYKDSSIFEPIPAGDQIVNWPATYGLDITVYNERSTPEWIS